MTIVSPQAECSTAMVSDDKAESCSICHEVYLCLSTSSYIRVTAGVIAIIGFTYTKGFEQIEATARSCSEYKHGAVEKGPNCLVDALALALGYSLVGVLGYQSDTACVAVLQKYVGLANTVNGDQGQRSNVKRDTFNPPLFTYNDLHTPNSTIDMMNHAIAVNKQQRAGSDEKRSRGPALHQQ